MKTSQIVKQIKVVISYPSDVDKEKEIIVRLCATLSNHIFSKKNIHINVRIDGFYKFYNYKGFEISNIEINREDALYSIDSLVAAIRMTPYPVYLFIDEYLNFRSYFLKINTVKPVKIIKNFDKIRYL